MHRERGALGSAAFKISPYKLGGRPLQGWRPGAMAPCPPPSVYATDHPPLDIARVTSSTFQGGGGGVIGPCHPTPLDPPLEH